MACDRSSSGKRRLLGCPRLPETRPAGPRFSKTAHSRRIWRSERPTNSAAFACVSRPSRTCRTTARRSSSLLLISTSSWATSPPFRRRHVAESGHFYLARSGHFHVASTPEGLIRRITSTQAVGHHTQYPVPSGPEPAPDLARHCAWCPPSVLLPLDGGGRLAADVEDHAVDAAHLVGDAAGDLRHQVPGQE